MTAARVAEIIALHGEAMTLRRPVGTTSTSFTDVTVTGKRQGFNGADLVGDLRQGDIEVRISNKEIAAAAWPGPPRNGDKLVAASKTYTVQNCDTRYHDGEIWLHILTVRG